MTELTRCYYSSALGEQHGWRGNVTHPAHLDAEGKLIPETAWSVEVREAKSLVALIEALGCLVAQKQGQTGFATSHSIKGKGETWKFL
mgnify:CR=1 FL=1